MHIFSDEELNQRVRRIKDRIDEIAEPLSAMGAAMAGQNVSISNPESASKLIQDIHENGLQIANKFLNSTLPDLAYIKQRVSSSDENYIEIADAIAITATAIVKMPVTSASMFTMASDFRSDKSLVGKVKSDLAEGTRIMGIISNLEISVQARHIVNQAINIINVAEQRASPRSGCFIATSVYGSYNSKEVMALRSYRDTVLRKSVIGRFFVSCYYFVSPKLVSIFGRNVFFKKICKEVLDLYILLIK